MPRNLKRYYGAGDLHYITCSCYHRRPWLGSARRRDLFLSVLEAMRKKYTFVVVGYVVMPEHIHLLISEPQRADPSVVMQAVKVDSPAGFSPKPGVAINFRCRQPIGLRISGSAVFMTSTFGRGEKAYGKIALYAPQSGQARAGGRARSVALEQFRFYAYGETETVRVNDWTILKMRTRERNTF